MKSIVVILLVCGSVKQLFDLFWSSILSWKIFLGLCTDNKARIVRKVPSKETNRLLWKFKQFNATGHYQDLWKDRCCLGDCYTKSLNFLKDGKFDKATAITALNTAFSAHPEWTPVIFSAWIFSIIIHSFFRLPKKLSMNAKPKVNLKLFGFF